MSVVDDIFEVYDCASSRWWLVSHDIAMKRLEIGFLSCTWSVQDDPLDPNVIVVIGHNFLFVESTVDARGFLWGIAPVAEIASSVSATLADAAMASGTACSGFLAQSRSRG